MIAFYHNNTYWFQICKLTKNMFSFAWNWRYGK